MNKFVFQWHLHFYIYFMYFVCTIQQITYLAALFLTLHSLNMYTILQTLHKKLQGGLKLRYKLRAIAYRLSNEIAVLVRVWSVTFLWTLYFLLYCNQSCLLSKRWLTKYAYKKCVLCSLVYVMEGQSTFQC